MAGGANASFRAGKSSAMRAVELVSLPFVPRRSWVKQVFAPMVGSMAQDRLTDHPGNDAGFVVASLLVEHDALHQAVEQSLCEKLIAARRVQLLDIGRSLTLAWPKGLLRAAALSGVDDPRLRNARVFVRSGTSALANRFHPPLPQHLKSSCEELGLHLANEAGALPPLERALVASMVLLTLHPFSDGNGRTARHVFVSWLFKHGITDPSHVSALAGCFSGGSLRLQLALKALRLGDTSQLLTLYQHSYSIARSEASEIHAELPFGTVRGEPALESLRRHLLSRML